MYDVKFLALLVAPYIYDISRLRVKHVPYFFSVFIAHFLPCCRATSLFCKIVRRNCEIFLLSMLLISELILVANMTILGGILSNVFNFFRYKFSENLYMLSGLKTGKVASHVCR
jgi:hypothetical protein